MTEQKRESDNKLQQNAKCRHCGSNDWIKHIDKTDNIIIAFECKKCGQLEYV